SVLALRTAHRGVHSVASAEQGFSRVTAKAAASAGDQNCFGHTRSPFAVLGLLKRPLGRNKFHLFWKVNQTVPVSYGVLMDITKLGNCLNSLIFGSCCTISRLRILSQLKR